MNTPAPVTKVQRRVRQGLKVIALVFGLLIMLRGILALYDLQNPQGYWLAEELHGQYIYEAGMYLDRDGTATLTSWRDGPISDTSFPLIVLKTMASAKQSAHAINHYEWVRFGRTIELTPSITSARIDLIGTRMKLFVPGFGKEYVLVKRTL